MKQFKIKYFSLIEVIASMAIFTILILMMMNFFGKTQDLMSKKSSQAAQYADAQAALDLIGTQLGNYADFKYKSTQGDLKTFEVVATDSKTIYYYTGEKGLTVSNKDSSLKLVGIRFDNATNKLMYIEKSYLPADLLAEEVLPSGVFNSATIGLNTGNLATNWEEVIGNVVSFDVELIDKNNSNIPLPFSYPSTTATKLPAMIQITLITVNDDDVVKYKALGGTDLTTDANAALTELDKTDPDIKTLPITQQVLASSVRRFTKTVYFGYRN